MVSYSSTITTMHGPIYIRWFNSYIGLVQIIKPSPGTQTCSRFGPFLQTLMSLLHSTGMKADFKLKIIQYFLRCRVNKISSSCPGGLGFEWNTGCTGLRWFPLVSNAENLTVCLRQDRRWKIPSTSLPIHHKEKSLLLQATYIIELQRDLLRKESIVPHLTQR